jgi:hypothetical protein
MIIANSLGNLVWNGVGFLEPPSAPPTPVGLYRILYENTGLVGYFDHTWSIDCDVVTTDSTISYRNRSNDPWTEFTLAQKQALLSQSGLTMEFQAIQIDNVADTLTRVVITQSGGDPEMMIPTIYPRLTVLNTSTYDTWAWGQAPEEYYTTCTATATEGSVTFTGL